MPPPSSGAVPAGAGMTGDVAAPRVMTNQETRERGR